MIRFRDSRNGGNSRGGARISLDKKQPVPEWTSKRATGLVTKETVSVEAEC